MVGLVIIIQGVFLFYVLEKLGSHDNEVNLVAFSFGLILPLAFFGVIAEFKLPLTLLGDVVMVLFFWKLWRKYHGTAPTSVIFAKINV